MTRALVFGGSGAVGSEVVRGLARAGVGVTFTFHRGKEKAALLAAETGATALPVNLADPRATRELLARVAAEEPSIFVHCAAVSKDLSLAALTDDDWEAAQRVNCHAAVLAAQALAPGMAKAKQGEIVILGALDRGQSVPIPVHFAASQGMVSGAVMALAKELGPAGIRVNQLAVGLLDGGLSRELPEKLRAEYKKFSALRRTGKPEEIAKAVLWLALENGYLTGRVVPVNGGL